MSRELVAQGAAVMGGWMDDQARIQGWMDREGQQGDPEADRTSLGVHVC